jgi:hypothetical protein
MTGVTNRWSLCLTAISFAIFITACFTNEKHIAPITSNTAILTTELSALNLDSPQKDLDRNLNYRDYRCIAVCGFICYHPGVAPTDVDVCRRFGSRTIIGTSDAIEGDEHGKLIATASKYASEYNTRLIPRLKDLK